MSKPSFFVNRSIYEGPMEGIYTEDNFERFVETEVCDLLGRQNIDNHFTRGDIKVLSRDTRTIIYNFSSSRFGIIHEIYYGSKRCSLDFTSNPDSRTAQEVYLFLLGRFELEKRRN